MTKAPHRTHQRGTHPIWWCAAVICTIITVGVIVAGITVFVGYLVIHPRVPVLSVVNGHLNLFQYSLTGTLVTQLLIVVRSENDNQKAHASFSDLKLFLLFQGQEIALLTTGYPYDVRKNSTLDFPFVATSDSISLNPEQMQDVDIMLRQDRIRFDLKGSARTRWRIGLLGSVKFWCHLNCQLHFQQSTGNYIPASRCSSRSK